MKKYGFVFLCIWLISGVVYAQQSRKVINPYYEVKNTGIYNIAKVVVNDTATVLDIYVTFLPGWWTKFSRDISLKDVKTDKIYPVKQILGATFEKELWTPKSGDTTVTLVFEPLDKGTKVFDYIGGDKDMIFGVDISRQKNTESKKIPKEVDNWLKRELAKSKNKTAIKDYNSTDFFKKDSVRIVGYIKGYDKRLGFSSGIIYNSNELTREDFPTTIKIHDDGRFEVDLALQHPAIHYLVINDSPIDCFYVEPGHTLGIVLDWEDFLQRDRYRDRSYFTRHTQYLGVLGAFNQNLFAIDIKRPDYKLLQNAQKKISPTDFKNNWVGQWQKEAKRVDSLLQARNADTKLSSLVKSGVNLTYANYLFDYTSNRDYYSKQDTANKILKMPIEDDYYDFVGLLNLNDQTYMVLDNFSTFINRFEFSPLFPRIAWNYSYAYIDSVAKQRFAEIPLMVQVAKVRTVQNRILPLKDSMGLDTIVRQIVQTLPSDFMKAEVVRLKEKKLKRDAGYDLPDTYGADVFRKIIDKHKGKILMVDFWAQWCGPCRAGIESHLADREKYTDHKDFAFLFVTDGSTEEDFYKDYTAKQKMANSYKISNEDYLALRELFKFNGIPHYILVGADGRILDDDFRMYDWKRELSRKFPDKFSYEYFK